MSKPPCDCFEVINGHYVNSCDCANSGNFATMENWCRDMNESKHDNGGPAFPVSTRPEEFDGGYGHQDSPSTYQFGGMTLRDAFAAKALQGLLANPSNDQQEPAWWANDAYMIADAMLRARKVSQS